MKSNNTPVVVALSSLCLILTFTLGFVVLNQGGVLGESTIAPRPWLTPTKSAFPTKYPVPTIASRDVPCYEITRIYKDYCSSPTVATITPGRPTVTPTANPTRRPTFIYPSKYPTPTKY